MWLGEGGVLGRYLGRVPGLHLRGPRERGASVGRSCEAPACHARFVREVKPHGKSSEIAAVEKILQLVETKLGKSVAIHDREVAYEGPESKRGQSVSGECIKLGPVKRPPRVVFCSSAAGVSLHVSPRVPARG